MFVNHKTVMGEELRQTLKARATALKGHYLKISEMEERPY